VNYWDEHANEFGVLAVDDLLYDLITEQHVQVISQLITDRGAETVAELGCGIGRLVIPLAKLHPDIFFVGMDQSLSMLSGLEDRMVKEKVPSVVWEGAPGILPYPISVSKGIPALGFDLIYCVLVIQHLDPSTVRSYFEDVGNALKPGGVFYFQFCHADEDAHPGEFSHFYSLATIKEYLNRAGLLFSEFHSIGDYDLSWMWCTASRLEAS
jgi:SAM-dependent methyltransferase